MIPQGQYSPRASKNLFEYLVEERRRAQRDRAAKEAAWVDYHAAYKAQPADEIKTFPFYGASNLVIPVIATDVDTLYSRLCGMLLEPPSLWSVTAQSPEMEAIAPRINEFLQWAQKNEIDVASPVSDWLLEMMKLGTGVLKTRYHREMRKVFEWRELEGGQTWQQVALLLLKDAPRVDRVPLFDFFVPAGFNNLQDAPWCAEGIAITYQRYLDRVRAGIYTGSDRIQEWSANSKGTRAAQDIAQISGYAASLGNKLQLYEHWVDWDIDEDGLPESLVCTIHEDSMSYVRLDYNPFFNQEKPYSVARFMRDENSFYGIGLAEMLWQFQEEITAMHNQRLDNGTVQNSQTFAVNKQNKNISQQELVYPSKIWLVNDTNDVKPIALGSTSSASSIQNEAHTLSYAERRVGTNDFVHAQTSPETTYGTAYSASQMLANSTRRQGEVLRESKRALSEVGTRVLELYQQFHQRGKEYLALGAQDGQLVKMVLQFPQDLIRRGLKVGVTAIDVEMSKDTQIRTNTIIMQLIQQYYTQALQAMSYVVNPQMPEPVRQMALQMVVGGNILARKVLDAYDTQDVDKILPPLQGMVETQEQSLARLFQLATLGGGQGAGAPAAALGGMAGGPPPHRGPLQLSAGPNQPGY